ncbi:MAG TPA: helix-turn-helix transcriptional regulator [Sphingopyxis sp.]|nr:helix-turn-helix transcriptional regulator [Sphingopyxis sp.]
MDGPQTSSTDDRLRWERLTDKQRACLDLLLERKTSKEIARLLGISKHTVDQRIRTARAALHANDRDDTAIRYARLKQIYDRIAYDTVDIPPLATIMPSGIADGGPANVLNLHDRSEKTESRGVLPLSGKIWRHDHGSTTRLLIIGAGLLATVLIFLGGLNIAETLSRLVSG